MIKAVALLSGGLDSRLAIRIMQEQGIEVHAVNYVSCFTTSGSRSRSRHKALMREGREAGGGPSRVFAVKAAAEQLGVPLKAVVISKELIEIVKKPKHGYGRNMNPCIDCRILTFRLAKEYMKDMGASFIITGEVLGQRPMSQRRDAMRLIDREANVEGLVLRPLSARRLSVTVPEREGWVDREKLLSIGGRSRKEQIRLAECYRIRDYPSSAGGCLLTYEGFANKVRDILAHKDADTNDMVLLKVGRHFRLPRGGKAVVGRNEEENRRILNLARVGDIIFRPPENLPAPTALLRDSDSEKEIAITADLCVSHSKLRTEPFIPIECYRYEAPSELRIINSGAMPREKIDALRI